MKTRDTFLIEVVLIAVCVTGIAPLPGLLASSWASPGSAKPEAASTPKATSQAAGIASLPMAAQSVISAAIGRDQSDYYAQPASNGGFGMVNSEGGLNVELAPSGVAVHVGGQKGADWFFALEAYGRGKSLNLVTSSPPQANANRVEYHHRGLTEWYVNSPFGLEQGFTLARPPTFAEDDSDQPLTIALSLSGDLTASLDSKGTGLALNQHDGKAVLRYAGLAAEDSAGVLLKCSLELHGTRLLLRINDAGARYPIVVDPWMQAAELSNSLGVAGDSFGRSVAVSGNTVVVGAPYATTNGHESQGAAYVFVEPAGGWATTGAYTAELINSSGAAGDNFGSSVAISGNTIVVGAPSGTSAGQGAAYVFVESTWSGQVAYNAKLTESAGVAGDLFGYSVGISGNTIVVGAPQANSYLGMAYVFVESTWSGPISSSIELPASNGVAGNLFGYSVGINESASMIAVGAPDVAFGPTPNTNQGAAYVFDEPTSGGWATPTTYVTFSSELFASDGATGDKLGTSVAISGSTVVGGAPNAKIGLNTAQGAAYVFVEPVDGWLLAEYDDAKLNAASGTSSTSLGNSVGISGNTVVAGAQGVSIGSNSATGAAYVFVEPTAAGGWASMPSENETSELTASVGASEAFLGYSVGISGNTVIAGAPSVSFGSSPTQGDAYVFTQPSAPGPYAQYSPTQVSFGNVGDNVPTTQTVTVTNTGTQSLIIQLVTPSADGTIFTITQTSCNGIVSSPPVYPVTISPTASCVFTVRFDPTAPGAINVQLGFEDNAGVGQSNVSSTQSGSNFLQSMPLSGTGDDAPIATYSPTTLSFGSVPVTTSVTQTVKLTNNGAGPLVLQLAGWVGGVAAGFSNTQIDCDYLSGPVTSLPPGSTLIPGSSCIFTVQFDPPSVGGFSGGFVIEDNAAPGQSNLTSIAVGNSSSVFAQVVSVSGGTFSTTTTITSTGSSLLGYALPAGYALVGNPITANFTVQPVSGGPVPTGPVSVMDGFQESCNPQATLNSANGGKGSCPLTINQVGSGSTTLSAQYTPDAASSSAGLLGSATVQPLVTENLVQIINCGTPPPAQSAPPGTTTVFTFTACLAGDVSGAVSAICGNLPSMASCNPAPMVTEIGTSGVYTVSISVVTAAAGISAPLQEHRPSRGLWPLALLGIATLLAMILARHFAGTEKLRMRPRLLYVAGFAIALALLLGNMNGCGSSSTPVSTGTPPNTYTINITIKAGTYSVVVPLNLTVTS